MSPSSTAISSSLFGYSAVIRHCRSFVYHYNGGIRMFEDIHIQSTSSVIEMSILEPNNELDVCIKVGVVRCTSYT